MEAGRMSANNHLNVLLTCMGSTTAISVAKALTVQNEYEIDIVGTDTYGRNMIAGSQFCHHFHTISPVHDEARYLEDIGRIIEAHRIDLVIPIIDPELEALARHRQRIEKETFLLLSPLATIQLCNDKLRMFRFLRAEGIPTFATFTLPAENPEQLSYPLIAKPRYGWGSHDVYRVNRKEDLSRLPRIQEPILQETGRGKEYTIDVFSDGNQVIAIIPRRRSETRAGITYRGETSHHPLLIEYAERITKALHICGPANIQCFADGNDIRILEINPRFSAGLPLSTGAGVNLPLLAAKMAKGESLTPQRSFKHVRMCRYWEEVFFDGI
jgi:carbamoyl-phosphate synthase large subunit